MSHWPSTLLVNEHSRKAIKNEKKNKKERNQPRIKQLNPNAKHDVS